MVHHLTNTNNYNCFICDDDKKNINLYLVLIQIFKLINLMAIIEFMTSRDELLTKFLLQSKFKFSF